MATINVKQALVMVANRDNITDFAANAVKQHGAAIRRETRKFDYAREADPVSWAKLCMIKAILSPGVKLDKNISLAKMLHVKMLTGWVPASYDDIEPYRASVKYGGPCVGQNITNLVAAWSTISTITADSMTWDGLTALYDANLLPGMGNKVRSWCLALYDASSRVITLDRHMLRELLPIAGIVAEANEYSAGGAAYPVIVELLLSVADELRCEPLVMQWAMWNEFRHVGQHASHAALAD